MQLVGYRLSIVTEIEPSKDHPFKVELEDYIDVTHKETRETVVDFAHDQQEVLANIAEEAGVTFSYDHENNGALVIIVGHSIPIDQVTDVFESLSGTIFELYLSNGFELLAQGFTQHETALAYCEELSTYNPNLLN